MADVTTISLASSSVAGRWIKEGECAVKLTRRSALTTLRKKLITNSVKVVTNSRHVVFRMADVAVPRTLFARVLERIQRFGVPPAVLGIG